MGEGPVQHRRTPAARFLWAGRLGQEAGSPPASGCLHVGALGGDRVAVLDTYGALAAEEQRVVTGDREPWLELAVGGPAAGKGGLFGHDVAAEVREPHRGKADQRQVVGAAVLVCPVQAAGVPGHSVRGAELCRGGVHLLHGHGRALVSAGKRAGCVVAGGHEHPLHQRHDVVGLPGRMATWVPSTFTSSCQHHDGRVWVQERDQGQRSQRLHGAGRRSGACGARATRICPVSMSARSKDAPGMGGRGGIPGARFTMTPDPDSCGRPRRGFRQQTPGEVPPGQNAPAAVSVRLSARGRTAH